jgi:hypothetical protein
LFARIQAGLDDLNIGQVQEQITQAFQELETFINDNINDAMTQDVRSALDPLVEQVQNLGIADLVDQLSSAVGSLQGVIDQLEDAVNSQIDQLNDLLSQLEGLSFQPISDEVIFEIDDIKARLEEINPDALSDVEKVAIMGAMAILEAIDLENQVIAGLKSGYHAAEVEIKRLLDQLNAALEQLSGKFMIFNPTDLMGPLDELIGEASSVVQGLNGQNLLGFLYDLLDELKATLQSLEPGRLLDPLQAPYDALMSQVNRLDPGEWVAPLEALYAQIDQLISLVDVTPLLDELDALQRQLFEDVRTTLINALDALSLPEPLGSFFTQIRPVLELITEALFGDPNIELSQLRLQVREHVDLTSLFAPLDQAFMQLVGLLDVIPPADLTSVLETARQGIGIGLDVLDPQAILNGLRRGHVFLAELSPINLLGVSQRLPALKVDFEARASTAPPDRQADVLAVSARFEVVFEGVRPGIVGNQMTQLIQSHSGAADALRQRINQLNTSSALESYTRLRRGLDKVLPDFLRQAQPLTYADIQAGIYAMRPSSKARIVEEALARFLRQAQSYADALEPGMNTFFETLRELMGLINPLAVKDSVTAIYDEIREKVRIIDPAALREHFEELLATLSEPLQAINPDQIKAQINGVYNSALNALTSRVAGILDDIVAAVDDILREIQLALQELIDQVRAAIRSILEGLEGVLGRVEALVFVDVLLRLERVIDNLGMSFDTELERVRNAFDAMLSAIPLDSGASVEVSVSI